MKRLRRLELHIGVCRLMLHLPDANSLKAKRQVARSLTARIRNQFNVAVAEVVYERARAEGIGRVLAL